MIRVLACGYLVLSLVVGPVACCCAFSRTTSSGTERASAAEPPACCCSADRDNDAKSTPAPKRTPGECPCRKSPNCCRIVEPGLATGSLSAQWLSLVSVAALAPAVEVPATAAATPPITDRAHRPFLECTDLLDVQHKLRC